MPKYLENCRPGTFPETEALAEVRDTMVGSDQRS